MEIGLGQACVLFWRFSFKAIQGGELISPGHFMDALDYIEACASTLIKWFVIEISLYLWTLLNWFIKALDLHVWFWCIRTLNLFYWTFGKIPVPKFDDIDSAAL